MNDFEKQVLLNTIEQLTIANSQQAEIIKKQTATIQSLSDKVEELTRQIEVLAAEIASKR